MLQTQYVRIQDYISVKDKGAVFLPHTAGRYAKQRFKKASCPIVERLLNAMVSWQLAWNCIVHARRFFL